MKLAITLRLTAELEAALLGDNVAYRPDLASKGAHAMRSMLASWQPDVLITASMPDRETIAAWRASIVLARRLTVIEVGEGSEAGETAPAVATRAAPLEAGSGVERVRIDRARTAQPEIDAFELAETLNRRALVPRAHARRSGTRVIMIGAGIVNLVTAYELVRNGFQVEVFDAGPDPSRPYDWQRHGCTFGGGDARIFSLNEARHHHHKGLAVSADSNTQFQRTIGDDGWLACAPTTLGPRDRSWIAEHEAMPPWLSGRFDRDIISFNQESHSWWRALIAAHPQLFADVGFCDGLVRIYAARDRYERARLGERRIGAVVRELDLADVAHDHPALAGAVASGEIAGALEVIGFSLNVQRFGRALISDLTDRGSVFHWGARANAARRDALGRVAGIEIGSAAVTGDHYVISPGAYGGTLLEGWKSDDAIAPMVGMWLTLPNTAPRLERPLKVSRAGFASSASTEGANVIAGWDPAYGEVIFVSGGHGYVGMDAGKLDPRGLADLTRAIDETAWRLFPDKCARGVELGMSSERPRYCIRPWTASGLGVFECAETADGGLAIVAGGHNTGGFAQSPSVARAVVAALRGEHHPMHGLYHPQRYRSFAGHPPG
jgi:D-amino-acid dehydrogenase